MTSESETPPLLEMNWTVTVAVKGERTAKQVTTARLCFKGEAVYALDGLDARRTLQEQADRWNREKYEPGLGGGDTRCLADVASEAARRELLLKWGGVRGPGMRGVKPFC